LKLFISEVLIL